MLFRSQACSEALYQARRSLRKRHQTDALNELKWMDKEELEKQLVFAKTQRKDIKESWQYIENHLQELKEVPIK